LGSFGITVIPVLLPGREARLREPAYRNVPDLVEALFDGLKNSLPARFAFFGHSMGAVLAFELARKLRTSSGLAPDILLVSGWGAPHIRASLEPWHTLSDEEFLERLAESNNSLRAIRPYRELMEILLPTLRADFELCATYEYRPGPALQCSIIAYGGAQDEEVSPEALAAWGIHTTGTFEYRLFPGSHWYINESGHQLQKRIGLDCGRR
jgi:medium-chain acyl-[acyl-carrier-protein] hydrolase